MADLAALIINDFSPYIGKFVRLCDVNVECRLLLKEARDAKRYARSGLVREPFSLIFSGPAGLSFEQGTYTLEFDVLGEVPIFLVPVGIEDGAMQLEAVFN